MAVRQERESTSEALGSSESDGSISDVALSVLLSGALVERGAIVLPAGVLSSSLGFLRVEDVEPAGVGACRIVRSTRIELT